MKTTLRIPYVLLTGLVVSLLNSQCSRPATDAAVPQSTCRIQQVTSTVKNARTNQTNQTQYEYDAAGNLLRKVYTFTQNGVAINQTYTTTETYRYDASNFLTRKELLTQEKSILPNQTIGYQYSATTDYTYSNDRLASYRLTDVNSSTTSSGIRQQRNVSNSQYEYDAAGQLTRQTFGQDQAITFQNGKVTSYYSGSSFQFTLTDGLITKAFFPGTKGPANTVSNLVQLRRYDDQRRPIEHRELINDTLSSYQTQAWQVGFTAEQSLPAFKGHPQIRSPYGEPGLMIDYRQFHVNQLQGNKEYETNRTTTVHELNAQGYVTRSTATTTYYTSGQQPDVTTTVYTYTNCN